MKWWSPLLARRIVLATSGATFLTIALIGIALPREVAGAYGFSLDRIESFNEFRAVYTGFWIALAAAMFTAARHVRLALLGDLCALMLVCQAAGRAMSFVLDGRPSWPFIAAFWLELLGGLTVLAMRVPRSESPRIAEGAVRA